MYEMRFYNIHNLVVVYKVNFLPPNMQVDIARILMNLSEFYIKSHRLKIVHILFIIYSCT